MMIYMEQFGVRFMLGHCRKQVAVLAGLGTAAADTMDVLAQRSKAIEGVGTS
jgi:hypothetical protein